MLIDYFRGVFRPNADLSEGAQKLHSFSRSILDLLRNMLVVGALQFFAKKTGSAVVDLVAIVGLCALFGYCISYTRVGFRPFHPLKNQQLALKLDMYADRIVFLVISIVVVIAVQIAVYEIAGAQVK